MKSPVIKRSIVIAGHKTSVSLEDAFWKGLKEIADDRSLTLSELVSTIDTDRRHGNLPSAIRLFVLDHYRHHAVVAREPAMPRRGPIRPRPVRAALRHCRSCPMHQPSCQARRQAHRAAAPARKRRRCRLRSTFHPLRDRGLRRGPKVRRRREAARGRPA